MGRVERIDNAQNTAPRRGGSGFALLSPAFLDELRDRTSLSSLIARTVKLTRAGNEYKACCPFHNEKSPSFYVNDDKGFYHCFGCSAHGDAIRWLTDGQGLSFIDAVKQLADAAGMELPKPDAATQARAERAQGLHGVVDAAQAWFAEQLRGIEGAAARAYLERRGFTAATLARFGFGFAPDSRGKLKAALKGQGERELIEAGLLISVEEKEPYDRFRGRVMIPIRDHRGQVIAFGGRVIGDGEPKYLNSPDTPLFDKGRTLFNLDRAGPAARKAGRIIAVEGYLDVIALDQAGIAEVVAPLGTALTEHQMERMWRIVDQPILCFDGDNAGRKAAIRAGERALPMLRPGKTILFATLPAGQDPDDVVRQGGAAAFEAAIANPEPLDRLLYRHEAGQADMGRPENRARLRARLDELAKGCADRIVAEEFRRSFNDLFYEDFGWKKQARRTIETALVRTAPALLRGDFTQSFLRSTLYGLSRFPRVIVERMEEISALPIDNADLARWRDALIDAVVRNPALDEDIIEAILASSDKPGMFRRNEARDLRFPHAVVGREAVEAIERLNALIDMLGEWRELKDELDALDKALAIDACGDGYNDIQAARARTDARMRVLRERGYRLDAAELN